MINFLHTNIPDPILLSIGQITIYKYGFIIALAITVLYFVTTYIAKFYKIEKEIIIDCVFYGSIFGIIGARTYEIFLELPYYIQNPTNILRIWNGGLAIHGALIAVFIFLLIFSKKKKLSFWELLSVGAPAFALAQAIGRWGNYFNQELYGLPTSLPWGISIVEAHKVSQYLNSTHFHPTFLYESIGSFIIFLLLISLHYLKTKDKITIKHSTIFLLYIILYSILRFSLEFIKIDITPIFLGLRTPQITSLIMVIISLGTLFYLSNISKKQKMLEKTIEKH